MHKLNMYVRMYVSIDRNVHAYWILNTCLRCRGRHNEQHNRDCTSNVTTSWPRDPEEWFSFPVEESCLATWWTLLYAPETVSREIISRGRERLFREWLLRERERERERRRGERREIVPREGERERERGREGKRREIVQREREFRERESLEWRKSQIETSHIHHFSCLPLNKCCRCNSG